MVIELIYPKRKFLISNVYHSPNPLTGQSVSSHNGEFLELLDEHLSDLCSSNVDSYLFLDSNIDLLRLESLDIAKEYLDVAICNGFMQLSCRATRIQGTSHSLIDHILTNANLPSYCNGTIISDVSDHFFNYLMLP